MRRIERGKASQKCRNRSAMLGSREKSMATRVLQSNHDHLTARLTLLRHGYIGPAFVAQSLWTCAAAPDPWATLAFDQHELL